MYKKLSRISLFFFIAYYNYILLRFIIFPHMYDSYGSNGIYIIILMLVILAIIFLALPKVLYKFDFSKSFSNSKIRFLVKPILFVRIVFGLTACSMLINELFFSNYNVFVILIGLVIVLGVISLGTSCDVIQLSTLFCIVCTSLYSLYILDFIDMDVTLINNNLSLEPITFIYVFIMIIDNFIYFLVNKEKIKMTKSVVISGITFSLISLGFEYVILLLSSGDKLFKGNLLSGFMALAIQPVSRYNGNFSYVYLMVITIAVIFKFSFFNSIIINKQYSKYKYFIYLILIFVFSICLEALFSYSHNLAIVLVLVLVLCCSILPIWMLKEAYHVRLDER